MLSILFLGLREEYRKVFGMSFHGNLGNGTRTRNNFSLALSKDALINNINSKDIVLLKLRGMIQSPLCIPNHIATGPALFCRYHRSQEMSLGILLLVAAVLKTSSGMPYLSCEYENMRNCNLGIAAGFKDHPNNPNTSLSCHVYQVPHYIYNN